MPFAVSLGEFPKTKGAVKLHTLLDLRGAIPAFVHVSQGKVHDVNILDRLAPEPGAFYVMDRAYLDFSRLHVLHLHGGYFVLRSKSNTKLRRIVSRPVDRTTGLICDQVVVPAGVTTSLNYPDRLRRIKYRDKKRNKVFVFLTNNFVLPALTITELYRARWQVELFFKWIKQHLRIKSFFVHRTTRSRASSGLRFSVYVLIAIIRKRLNLELNLHTILQILSLSVFEKMPLKQLLVQGAHQIEDLPSDNQLKLFD